MRWEVVRMKAMLATLVGLLLAAGAGAGDVYVVTDAEGNRVYTDRPQTLPAERVDVHVSETNAADAARAAQQTQRAASDEAAYDAQQAQTAEAAKAKELTAEDRARRCVDARQRYQATMDAIRLYEVGPDGDRRYLTSDEIDAARANARAAMDTFCAGQ
jgi:hypothetical protein